MPKAERLFYASSSGDAWYLVRDPDGLNVSVRHDPNAPSGGASSCIPVADFLAQTGGKAEHQELLRLVATLIDSVPEEVSEQITDVLR